MADSVVTNTYFIKNQFKRTITYLHCNLLANSTKKIKLLIVVPALECGGLERNVSIICNNIDTAKFDVVLAVVNNSNQFFKITNPAVTVIDLQIVHVRNSLFKIIGLSRRLKPDIIFTTSNHLNLMFAIFRNLFPKNTRIIARESSIVSINSRRAKLPKLYGKLLKKFYRKLDFIVCQSVYMQEDLVQHYHIPVERTTVIYNAVESPKQMIDNTGDPSFAKLITVARLSPEKGIRRLIEAVALLKIPFKFTIIGEGGSRLQLQQLIDKLSLQQKVFLMGNSNTPFAEVAGADLFLMGSYYEGFPNALLESLAAGIPAVAFEVPGGISEILIDQENGLSVKNDSVEEYAEAIKRALEFNFNKEFICRSTLDRFNVEVTILQWQKLFEDSVYGSKMQSGFLHAASL